MGDVKTDTVSRAEYMELLADRNNLANQLEESKQLNWLGNNLTPRQQLGFLQIAAEFTKEQKFYGNYPSIHHGIGMIYHRLADLEIQVFKPAHELDSNKIRAASMRLASVAARLMIGCTE